MHSDICLVGFDKREIAPRSVVPAWDPWIPAFAIIPIAAAVSSIDNQRNQIIGVSSDEELTNMIKFQSAYNAASRYITVISEMTELIVTGLK